MNSIQQQIDDSNRTRIHQKYNADIQQKRNKNRSSVVTRFFFAQSLGPFVVVKGRRHEDKFIGTDWALQRYSSIQKPLPGRSPDKKTTSYIRKEPKPVPQYDALLQSRKLSLNIALPSLSLARSNRRTKSPSPFHTGETLGFFYSFNPTTTTTTTNTTVILDWASIFEQKSCLHSSTLRCSTPPTCKPSQTCVFRWYHVLTMEASF